MDACEDENLNASLFLCSLYFSPLLIFLAHCQALLQLTEGCLITLARAPGGLCWVEKEISYAYGIYILSYFLLALCDCMHSR